MGQLTRYNVRSKDMKVLVRLLNRPQASLDDVYDAARTLVGWAETQQTQPPPVSVASLALPSPEADALDRIADAYLDSQLYAEALSEIAGILRETGRL